MSAPETHRTLLAPAFLPVDEEEQAPTPESHAAEELPDQWPPAPAEPVPPGAPLADLIAAGLQHRGWHVDYRWTTFEGHAMDARRNDNRYDVELRLLDGPHDEGRGLWLITAKRRTGFFTRWLPGRGDPSEHALLRLSIDEALASDARAATDAVRDTKWTTEDGWTER